MNKFRVIDFSKVPGRKDVLVVLEILEGRIEAISGHLFDEKGVFWRLTSIALHEPENLSNQSDRRMVGLQGESSLSIGCILVDQAPEHS